MLWHHREVSDPASCDCLSKAVPTLNMSGNVCVFQWTMARHARRHGSYSSVSVHCSTGTCGMLVGGWGMELGIPCQRASLSFCRWWLGGNMWTACAWTLDSSASDLLQFSVLLSYTLSSWIIIIVCGYYVLLHNEWVCCTAVCIVFTTVHVGDAAILVLILREIKEWVVVVPTISGLLSE